MFRTAECMASLGSRVWYIDTDIMDSQTLVLLDSHSLIPTTYSIIIFQNILRIHPHYSTIPKTVGAILSDAPTRAMHSMVRSLTAYIADTERRQQQQQGTAGVDTQLAIKTRKTTRQWPRP